MSFLLFFIFWIMFRGVGTFQNFDLKLQSYHYLFTYLFIFEILEIQFMVHYEESEAAIHKCYKDSSWIFFKIHRKTPEQKSYFKKISYLKPAILLKKRLQHRCFTVSFSEFFRTATFDNISGWLLLVPCKLENNYVVTNKDF